MAEKIKFMTDKAKKKIIKSHRSPVICPGCRNVIAEEEDMGKVEYVRTKERLMYSSIRRVWRKCGGKRGCLQE